ncbi:MAG: hypothetical protein WCG55_04155 [bacterium]
MNKKYITALALTAVVATSLAGAQAFAETQDPATPPQASHGLAGRLEGMMRKGQGQRGMFGTVSAITGNTFTFTVKARPMRADKNQTTTVQPTTTYTVDATNATVMKSGKKVTVADIANGDTLIVMGQTTGTTITATRIMDGVPAMGGERPEGTTPAFTGNGMPVIAGKIATISGNTVTVSNRENVTYTVDVTNAKVEQKGTASTVSSLTIGDMVIVQGTVNGTTVTATSVIDQGVAQAPETSSKETNQAPEKQGFFSKIGSFFGRFF